MSINTYSLKKLKKKKRKRKRDNKDKSAMNSWMNMERPQERGKLRNTYTLSFGGKDTSPSAKVPWGSPDL